MKDNIADRLAKAMTDAAKSIERSAALIDAALKRHQADLAATLGAMNAPAEDNSAPHDPNASPVDGWREWHGGFPPVGPDEWVWVKYRNGVIDRRCVPKKEAWRHYKAAPSGDDIVKWQPAS